MAGTPGLSRGRDAGLGCGRDAGLGRGRNAAAFAAYLSALGSQVSSHLSAAARRPGGSRHHPAGLVRTSPARTGHLAFALNTGR